MDRPPVGATGLGLIALLGVLSAAGPLSTDMYLPSLPSIGADFGVGVGRTQLTLSAFLFGFAVGQMICGPIADRFGRRPTLIVGFGLYTLTSLVCLFAPNIETLIGLRFVQAMGASVGAAITRAIVRDLFDAEGAARTLSHMATVMALVPAAAPLAGGAMQVAFGWRANFAAMTLFGGLAVLLTVFKLTETLRAPDPTATNPGRILSNFARMLAHRQYLGCALSGTFSFCGLFAFISGSSFVLIGVFGVPEQHFGFYFGAPVVGYITGTQLGGKMTRHHTVNAILGRGVTVVALAGALATVLALTRIDHPYAIVGPVILYMVGVGQVLPQALAGALTPFPDRAGTASSLLGFIQMGSGAVVGTLVGVLHNDTQVPMAVMIGVMGALSLLSFRLVARPTFDQSAGKKETPGQS